MIEITQVNASLDEAGDENACLIVGKRVAKRVLRCKGSEIKSIELHRKSIDARKKRDVHVILSFRVELTSPHLEREAVGSVSERDRSHVRAIDDDEPSFPFPVSGAPKERPVVIGAGHPGLQVQRSDVMADALRPPARTFMLGGDVLWDLDLSG